MLPAPTATRNMQYIIPGLTVVGTKNVHMKAKKYNRNPDKTNNVLPIDPALSCFI